MDVLNGFDPKNNAQDRRILYEVTGMRLDLHEFRDQYSSESEESEEEIGHSRSYFDLDNAYLYGSYAAERQDTDVGDPNSLNRWLGYRNESVACEAETYLKEQ